MFTFCYTKNKYHVFRLDARLQLEHVGTLLLFLRTVARLFTLNTEFNYIFRVYFRIEKAILASVKKCQSFLFTPIQCVSGWKSDEISCHSLPYKIEECRHFLVNHQSLPQRIEECRHFLVTHYLRGLRSVGTLL